MRPVCGSGGVDRAGGQRQLRGKEGRGTGEEREGVGTVGYGTTDSGSDKERHIGTGGLDGKGRGIKPSGGCGGGGGGGMRITVWYGGI